jgi:hypothetical protein
MTTNFFQAAILDRSYPNSKISGGMPYKNLGRLYRVLFKSFLRAEIKRVNVKIWLTKKLDRIFDA